MPYETESLAALNRRLAAELPITGSGTALRRNLYTPFARALAGAVHGLHGHIEWRTRQMFPQTCDDDVLEYLHAPMWLGEGRLNAVEERIDVGVRVGVVPDSRLTVKRICESESQSSIVSALSPFLTTRPSSSNTSWNIG